MQFWKRFSAVLSAALIMSRGGITAQAAEVYAAPDGTSLTLEQVISPSKWKKIMASEQDKLPEKKNGLQCYWNHYGLSESVYAYTTKKCAHTSGKTDYCNHFLPNQYTLTEDFHIIVDGKSDTGITSINKPYRQCIGFARLLAIDAFQTDYFIRYTLENKNNSKYLHYYSGRMEKYQPRVGDNVRISTSRGEGYDHSIFITEVGKDSKGDYVLLAQCNADFETCQIDWNVKMYVSELLSRAIYVERVILSGDLNLDGLVNQTDVNIFANTIMKNGTNNGLGYELYDVNSDGIVNESDYIRLKDIASSGDSNQALIYKKQPHTTQSVWRACPEGDFVTNGLFYKKLQDGTVSFVGVLNPNQKAVTLSSRVYNQNDRRYYTVTEVGVPSKKSMASVTTDRITYITLPETIKVIRRGAFQSGNKSSLQMLNFSDSNIQLETIENEAFYMAQNLKSLDLSNANKLKTIGDNAFIGCSGLKSIFFPGYTNQSETIVLKLGTTKGILPEYDPNNPNIISLYFKNTNLALRRIEMQYSDVTRWQNSSVRIYSSRSRFNDNSNDLLAQTLGYNTIRTYYKETYQ